MTYRQSRINFDKRDYLRVKQMNWDESTEIPYIFL